LGISFCFKKGVLQRHVIIFVRFLAKDWWRRRANRGVFFFLGGGGGEGKSVFWGGGGGVLGEMYSPHFLKSKKERGRGRGLRHSN